MSSQEKLVMIVEDDDSVLEFLEHVVGKEGFQVEKIQYGDKAMSRIKKVIPALVILDLMLPRYGGFDILRELQAEGLASIPIVVITGRYTDKSTQEMIRSESNVAEFIEKPIQPMVLISTLHHILKTKSPHSA
ncbi:MAG: response regulator [Elusimicrobia bacterium]|nr:response regulator [Elusimicrobiota bacterium]